MNDFAKLRNILANTSLFKMLSEDQLTRVAANTVALTAGPNTSIVSQGEVGEGPYWIVYGQVRISLASPQGNEKTVAILGQGKCFGLAETLLDRPHAACVNSTKDSLLLHTRRETVLGLAGENLEFAREMMRCLGRQIQTLMLDIETYSQHGRQRLAAYLLRHGSPETGDEIELVTKKLLIASRLSLTPETLSHLFRDFSEEGLIRVAGRRITILDRERMAALAP